jgi:hypothetical protein
MSDPTPADLAAYVRALRTASQALVEPTGGVRRRETGGARREDDECQITTTWGTWALLRVLLHPDDLEPLLDVDTDNQMTAPAVEKLRAAADLARRADPGDARFHRP